MTRSKDVSRENIKKIMSDNALIVLREGWVN